MALVPAVLVREAAGLEDDGEGEGILSVAHILARPPAREGTVASSTLSLVVSACGAGVLSLPYALRCTGWAAGSVTLLVLAVASAWSLELIEMRARDLRVFSLEEIGSALWGPRVGFLIEVLLFLLLSVAQVTFLVLLGDLLPTLCARAYAPGTPPAACSRSNAISASLLLAALPSLLNRLHALRHVSLGALACLGFLLGVIVAHLLLALRDGDLGGGSSARPVHAIRPLNSRAWLAAFPIQTAAFCNQFNYGQMMLELREPTKRRLLAVRLSSVCACAAVCTAYGLVGYFLFGETVGGDLLASFDEQRRADAGGGASGAGGAGGRGSLDGALLVGKGALAACLILKVPLLIQPMRHIALGWAARACCCRGCAAQADSRLTSPLLSAGAKPRGQAEQPPRRCACRARTRAAIAHCATTGLLLVGIYGASTSLERVEDVFSIAGALGLMVVCFVIPGSFAFRPHFSVARRATGRQRAQGAALIVLGAVLSVTSLYACVADLVQRG